MTLLLRIEMALRASYLSSDPSEVKGWMIDRDQILLQTVCGHGLFFCWELWCQVEVVVEDLQSW